VIENQSWTLLNRIGQVLQSHNPYLDWILKKKIFIHFYLVDYFFNFEFTSLSERYMKPGISKWQHDHWVCTMAQVIIYLR
jgi:hypothetical protein